MITFVHPHGIGTAVIQLKDPEFNDGTIRRGEVAFETAMDGSLWGIKRPVTKRFTLQFKDLSRKKALELRDFLLATKDNLKTTYFDYSSEEWIGKISDPKFIITTDGTGPGDPAVRYESNSIYLTFEGTHA